MASRTFPNLGRMLLMVRTRPNEEEGRRYLMMEHDDQGLKAVDDPGFIDVTDLPYSPTSSSDPGYSSGSESLSPGLLSPMGSTAVAHDKNLNQQSIMPTAGFEDFMGAGVFEDDPFSLSSTSDSTISSVPMTSQSASSPYIIPSRSNTISGISAGSSPVKMNYNAFESDMIEMDVEESGGGGGGVGGDKSITLTLQAGAHQQGQDLNTLLLKALKTLVPVQTQGGPQNIEISIEPTSTATSVKSVSKAAFKNNIQLGGTSINGANQSSGKIQHVVNGKNIGFSGPADHLGTATDVLGTSPGSDNMMDFSVSKFPESSLNQKINETPMGPFDLFTGSDFIDSSSSQLLDDVLSLSDTNPVSGSLADNLLNDVSLGTTVDTVPLQSFSSTSTSPSMQCTSSGSKPLVMSTPASSSSSLSASLSSKSQASSKSQGSHYSSNKTLHSQNNSHHVNTKTLIQHTNGTNTAHLKYNNSHKIDFEAAKRGLDDHSYTAKCPSRNNNGHVKFATNSDKKRSRPDGTLLEHFLTTDKPLNPMRGSDSVAHSVSQLKLDDRFGSGKKTSKPTLLKKLLTEDRCKSESSNSLTVSTSTSVTAKPAATAAAAATVSSAAETAGLSQSVFDEPAVADLGNMLDSAADLDDESVWNDVSKQDMNELCLSSDINEILEQENWLQEEWMKHFLDNVL